MIIINDDNIDNINHTNDNSNYLKRSHVYDECIEK